MLRVFCPEWDGAGAVPPLSSEEAHHLVRVRRVRDGEEVEILNGLGAVGLATAATTRKNAVGLHLESVCMAPEASPRLRLLVALPKGKTFPLLLHRAVELGVREIVPLLTANVEATEERAQGKSQRWQAVLIEALKQSGNPWLPGLAEPMPLPEALGAFAPAKRICGALQPDALPLWNVLQEGFTDTGWAEVYIGPEGDFTPSEYGLLRESGCRFVSLGPLVLKVETAASLLTGAIRLRGLAES